MTQNACSEAQRQNSPVQRLLAVCTVLAVSGVMTGATCQQWAQDVTAQRKAGKLLVLLCAGPNLDRCQGFADIDVSNETVKLDDHEIRARLGNDPVRSLQVSCGRPTSIVVWELCNFR